jgi:hypothetical protein
MNEKQIADQMKKMDDWNREWEKGQKVLVRPDNDGVHKEYEAITRSRAYMLYGEAFVWLENGIEIKLDVVRAMMPCNYCGHLLAEPFPFETECGIAVCADCGQERNMQ